MYGDVRTRLQGELDAIRQAGLWKDERLIESAQAARITVRGRDVLNFCANNYLGLANDPRLIRAAQDGLARWGFGLASVRFICGTQSIPSTLGKALGGASGGFTTGRREIVELLRQRSRPYLFSNTLPPALVCAGLACLDVLSESTELRDHLAANTRWFRQAMSEAGFAIRPGEHPIVPIMLGDARLAHQVAADLLERGIYVVGFSYPVVPQGQARIRVQISAAHEPAHLERAVAAFVEVGRAHHVI
jgi:glycine C-acetyltransferase